MEKRKKASTSLEDERVIIEPEAEGRLCGNPPPVQACNNPLFMFGLLINKSKAAPLNEACSILSLQAIRPALMG